MTRRQMVLVAACIIALLTVAVLAYLQQGEPCQPAGSFRCFR